MFPYRTVSYFRLSLLCLRLTLIARSEATKQSPHQEIASLSLAMTRVVTIFKYLSEIEIKG